MYMVSSGQVGRGLRLWVPDVLPASVAGRWLLQLLFLKWWRLVFYCILIVPGTCLLRCLPGVSLAVVLPGLWLIVVLPLAIPDWLPIFLFLSAGNHILFNFRLSSFLFKFQQMRLMDVRRVQNVIEAGCGADCWWNGWTWKFAGSQGCISKVNCKWWLRGRRG